METNEIPIGDRSSSAKVNTKYVDINVVTPTLGPLEIWGIIRPIEEIVIIRKPQAATNTPNPIFRGAEGSLPLFANAENMAMETGVSATT